MEHYMGSALPNTCDICLPMPEETLVALFDALALSPRLTFVEFYTSSQVSLGGCRDAFVSMVANSNSIIHASCRYVNLFGDEDGQEDVKVSFRNTLNFYCYLNKIQAHRLVLEGTAPLALWPLLLAHLGKDGPKRHIVDTMYHLIREKNDALFSPKKVSAVLQL